MCIVFGSSRDARACECGEELDHGLTQPLLERCKLQAVHLRLVERERQVGRVRRAVVPGREAERVREYCRTRTTQT